MKLYWLNVTNIDWDTDNEPVETLPSEKRYLATEEELKDISYVTDRLSDEYGFCVFSYSCEAEEIPELSEEDLTKEYFVGFKGYTICREDYESMPCPLYTRDLTDDQMQILAGNIGAELHQYYDEAEDNDDNDFWEIMERNATEMGMCYYEDL